MKKLPYFILDVFTNQPYKGNPLSVVWCDDELELSQYYNIAREFGYSETSFVWYSDAEKALKVRSFTPGNYEVGGGGHNFLGAVSLALLQGWDIFNGQGDEHWVTMKDEKLPVVINEENGLILVAVKQQTAQNLGTITPEIIAPALGLETTELELNNWKPTVMKTEVAHIMVPIKNRAILNRAVPNSDLLKEISKNYSFEGFYLFTTDVSENDYLTETRFFNPAYGIEEDPATGTAAGPLAGFLQQANYININQGYKILQGVLVNHPSTIHIKVTPDNVLVSGSSVIVMEGTLFL
ncbi:PhzF family phenazine biosynthesis protein [Mucilaginibacter sp. cycad4]|uniref:PhzF family phenazine biosynthesis protein n=1 Tax=Mucilaginibacter sp. cycad4 TaxID=3342096 RepID=UPI002AAB1E67|nr:PhzF family phenazine biosynthesis protein [Mucilaginibacter gossypii]WPV00149.1 PhzF family phenazine biosynthesis protein [Mucilaginibacter gossypii]